MPPMCTAVRELLPEFVLGVLPADQRAEVEAHVAWCAGCRKESAELGAGAATLAFALPPATPPQHVEEAVVDSIHSSSSVPAGRRRARAAATATIAAMVAISALGWGAVMAGRAERAEVRAERERRERFAALEDFQQVFSLGGFDRPSLNEAHIGHLDAVDPDGLGGGAVLQLVSGSNPDFAFVIVSGLPTGRARMPYRIYLSNAEGDELKAGRIAAVDPADGTAEAFKEFRARDLTGYTDVVVRDANGEIVLRGTVDTDV
jgi:hypothetical protein